MSGVAVQRAVFLLHVVRLPVALFTVPTVVATLLGAASSRIAPALMKRGMTPAQLIFIATPAGAVSMIILPMAVGPVAWIAAAACMSAGLPMLFGAAANIAVVTIISEQIGNEFSAASPRFSPQPPRRPAWLARSWAGRWATASVSATGSGRVWQWPSSQPPCCRWPHGIGPPAQERAGTAEMVADPSLVGGK